ncbi:MAG: hypothetical protein JSR47_09370 [Proteobacteria bacterium]|nr:hypothetical protein [Pseudomonadota bacterium]
MIRHKRLIGLSDVPFVMGILMITIGTPLFAFLGKNAAASCVLVAGIVAVLVGRLHLVEELALGPLKARLRASIDEANATTQQLRSVAIALAEASLTDLMSGNFFDGMSLHRRFEMRDIIVKSLVELGLTQSDIQNASRTWNKGIQVTYHRAIRNAFPKEIDQKARDEFESMLGFRRLVSANPRPVRSLRQEK